MSSRTSVAAAGALALALHAATAAALDVKLWPLFRYARDDTRGLVRWSMFGPLVEFTRTPETRDLRIRPFLALHQRRGAVHDDSAEILYPLAASRWEEDYQTFRFLVFTYRTRPSSDTSRFNVFPLVFYRHDPERGTRLSVLPFWLNVDDFFGYQHASAVLFPAYLRLDEPGVDRRYTPFPFVSRVDGELGSGFRVWPFWGDTEIRGQQHTHYVMWPFSIRSERLVPGYGWERRRLYLPAYAAIDGAGRETRAYGLFAYVHTVDTRHGVESTGAPWPFVVRERALGETEYRVWRLFPFYGRSDNHGISSRFYAWPAYRTKTQDDEGFHYQRRDVGLVLGRHQHVTSEQSGRDDDLLTIFPVLRSEREGERRFGQTPALADSLLPKNRGVLDMWAPLYGLLRWDTRPDGALDWNAAWGLVGREDGRMRGPWHLDFGEGDGA